MVGMRLRAVHLVCFLLLLSSAGAADAAALRSADLGLADHYVGLLLQSAATARAAATLGRNHADAPVPADILAPRALAGPATLHDPAALAAGVHAVTGSGL